MIYKFRVTFYVPLKCPTVFDSGFDLPDSQQSFEDFIYKQKNPLTKSFPVAGISIRDNTHLVQSIGLPEYIPSIRCWCI